MINLTQRRHDMDIIHIVRIFTKFSINYREIIFNSLLNDATSEGCLIDEVLVLVLEWNPTILLRSRSYSSSSNLHDSISYAYYHLRTSEGAIYSSSLMPFLYPQFTIEEYFKKLRDEVTNTCNLIYYSLHLFTYIAYYIWMLLLFMNYYEKEWILVLLSHSIWLYTLDSESLVLYDTWMIYFPLVYVFASWFHRHPTLQI